MHRWLLPMLLGLALAVTGCAAHPPDPDPDLDWPRSPGQVVFQIDTVGGMMSPFDHEAHVPELTVFGDGQAVFTRRDSQGAERILQAQLSPDQLGKLLALADHNLTGLQGHYTALVVTDVGDTRFSVVTNAGTRQVAVYAFPNEPTEMEEPKAVMDRLRAVRNAFLAALSPGAEPYAPASVTILTRQMESDSWPRPPRDWPADLPPLPEPPAADRWAIARAPLDGAPAQQLVSQIPHRSHQPTASPINPTSSESSRRFLTCGRNKRSHHTAVMAPSLYRNCPFR